MIKPTEETERLKEIELFAYLGEDEYGSGEIGLKQALVPAGCIPMVAVDREKMERYKHLLQAQSDSGGKTIYFCRYELKEIIAVCKPGSES